MALLCLVSDRRRLSTAYGQDELSRLVNQVSAAADAGIDLIHVRERDLDGGRLAELVGRCVAAVSGSTARVLVNDRVDVALAASAHGVHLRGDSVPASRVRALVSPSMTVGRSVHSVAEGVREAESGGLDFLVVGPVFETISKPGRSRWLGGNLVADLARRVSLPVLAIGGMTVDRLQSIARTGAAGFAAIGLFADPSSPAALARIVRDARKTFDMYQTRA